MSSINPHPQYGGFHSHGGTLKQMVYLLDNPIKLDDELGVALLPLFRKPPHSGDDIPRILKSSNQGWIINQSTGDSMKSKISWYSHCVRAAKPLVLVHDSFGVLLPGYCITLYTFYQGISSMNWDSRLIFHYLW